MADTYVVRRATEIHAPAAVVYPLIADFRQWQVWSPFERLGPDMERTYRGAETGVGSIYAWSGSMKAGTGRMEMTDATAPSRVVVAQRNLKPIKSASTSTFTLIESAGVTTVTWTSTGPMTRMSKLLGVFKSMEDLVGLMFEKGLDGLRSAAEAESAR